MSESRDQYSNNVDDALSFAADAFRGRVRKTTDIPYLSHLLQVMVTVMEHGGDEDQMIAAVLHDYLEDIDGASVDVLRDRFGQRVADLVEALSESTERPKPAWELRKRKYIEHLRAAPEAVKLISAADKLHNVRSTLRAHAALGAAVWDRFNAGRDRSLWFYREVVTALSTDWQHAVLEELRAEVERLERTTG